MSSCRRDHGCSGSRVLYGGIRLSGGHRFPSPIRWILGVSMVLSLTMFIQCSSNSTVPGPDAARIADETARHGDAGAAPSPRDGKGTATVDPGGPYQAGSPGTWTITYTAAGDGIAVGGGVVLQVSPFWQWSDPQVVTPEMPGYTTVTCSNPRVELDVSAGGNYWVVARLGERPLEAGESITFVYGDTAGGANPHGAARADRFAERGEHFFVKVDGDGDEFFAEIAEHPSVDIIASEPVGLFVTADSWIRPGETFSLRVSALDRVWNRVERFRGRVVLHIPPGLELVEGDDGPFTDAERGARTFTLKALEEGLYRVTARDADGRLGEGQSNTIFCGEMLNEYRLYWADLQCHSRISDGSGSPEELLAYGRDVTGLHVCALTDHDSWGIQPMDEHQELFRQGLDATAALHEPGRYVTFPAYEWTSWTYGHKHVLFLHPGEAEIFSFRSPESETPDELWARLEGREVMTISHHVGGGPIPCDWDYHDPRYERLVEMCSIHGSSEYYGCPRSIYRPVEGRFAQDALARGYRLGWVGSGDTHNGHAGAGDPQSATGGLAGIYSTGLTREEIWDALQSRRVFATAGQKIVVNFLVNGALMGREIALDDPVEPRVIMGMAVGVAGLETLEVIKNNRTLLVERCAGETIKRLAAVDAEPAVAGDFYYLRVTQVDGEQAWSSPVWIAETGAAAGPGAAADTPAH